MGHVTIRLAEGHFLWVVHCDHTPIFHSYGDIEPQTLDAHTDAQVIYTLSNDMHCIGQTKILFLLLRAKV